MNKISSFARRKILPHKTVVPIHPQFLRSRCIFIHVPKCAGSSIMLNWLGAQAGHLTVADYERRLGTDFDNFYRFSIVRNPVERFKSAFGFIKQGGISDEDRRFLKKYENYFMSDSFNDILRLIAAGDLRYFHFSTQMSYLAKADGGIGVNYVHRIERDAVDLKNRLHSEGFQGVADMVFQALQPDKACNRSSDDTDYSDLDLDLLRHIYDADFWRLGY